MDLNELPLAATPQLPNLPCLQPMPPWWRCWMLDSESSRQRMPPPSRALQRLSRLLPPHMPLLPPPLQKPRTCEPPKGKCLPQAVVQCRGHISPEDHPSFTELVPCLNNALHTNQKPSHVHMVCVKWAQASNLLVCTQATSLQTLVATIEVVHLVLIDDQMTISDIIPNTR